MRALIGTLLFLMLAPLASAKTPYVLAILPDTQTTCRLGDLDWPPPTPMIKIEHTRTWRRCGWMEM